MSDEVFFDGRIRKCSLPLLTPPTSPEAPVCKRLALPQGELAQIFDADQSLRYLAYLELQPGTVRGNHYHERKEEFFYVISGKVLLVAEELASGRRESIPLVAGDRVQIQVRIAHAFKVEEGGSAVEFSPERFDAADTFRKALV